MLTRLLAINLKSQTIIWARIQQIIGITAAVTLQLLQFFDGLSPDLIAPWAPPKLVPALPLILFAMGKLTEILRKRPGSTDPVS